MQVVLSSRQMQLTDRYTREGIGMPSLVLMERAALAAAERILQLTDPKSRILFLCGQGGNGGDSYAAARLVLQMRPLTRTCFAGNEERMSSDCRHQKAVYKKLGGKEIPLQAVEEEYDLIVDGIYGVGLSRQVSEEMCHLFTAVNKGSAYVISLDLPSGINGDDGSIMGGAVMADETVTFQFLKRGHLLFPGRQYCGKVTVADVGIVLDPHFCAETFTMNISDISAWLPPRFMRSHKGTYGRCLIAAGSRNMAGCAVLAGKAALAMGCGLMRLLSPEENRIILQQAVPEGLYTPTDQDPEGNDVRQAAAWASGAGIGPGIGTGADAKSLLLGFLRECTCPLVLDADALTMLSGDEEVKEAAASRGAALVMTPHPGEMARLLHCDLTYILDHMIECALQAAGRYHAVVVLKDAATVVTDGVRVYINTSGCDGMAGGGSGDVLTGMISSLLAQHMDPFMGACLGVFLHGLAGETAQAEKGRRSMTAGDITANLPAVLDEIKTE